MVVYTENKYIFHQEGNLPVILTFPHSGWELIEGVETRKKGVLEGDNYTSNVANYMIQLFNCLNCCCKSVGGCNEDSKCTTNNNSNDNCCNSKNSESNSNSNISSSSNTEKEACCCCCESLVYPLDVNNYKFNAECYRPFIIFSKVDRKHCDMNRGKEIAFEDARLEVHYNEYHNTLIDFIGKASKLVGGDPSRVLLLDIHGQSDIKDHILRGTRNLATVQPIVKRAGVSAINGPHSVLGYFHRNGVPVFPMLVPKEYDNNQQNPPPVPPPSKVVLDPYKEHPHYSGAFTVHNYSTKYNINCIQVEFGLYLRKFEDQRLKIVRLLRESIFEVYEHHLKI